MVTVEIFKNTITFKKRETEKKGRKVGITAVPVFSTTSTHFFQNDLQAFPETPIIRVC
jgi:hypothetical protein